jgi:hypothetical protein
MVRGARESGDHDEEETKKDRITEELQHFTSCFDRACATTDNGGWQTGCARRGAARQIALLKASNTKTILNRNSLK